MHPRLDQLDGLHHYHSRIGGVDAAVHLLDHGRMKDGLQPGKGLGIGEDDITQFGAVNNTIGLSRSALS